jgi:hypothetical protein
MNNPLIDLIRYVAESKYPDATKEELDFIAYNVMKEIDDEMVSKLKKSVGEDLQINYPRRNAKSGMDCCRLTGINPYIEQEEQKKKRVRK